MPHHDNILTHLHRDYNRPVRDPLWKHIYLSDSFTHMVNSTAFQQLNRIKQLGPSFLVYPGATHTRMSHSLGVFHIAKRMITTLLAHPDCPPLTQEGVTAFLGASLLHDVGHFPYAHSLKELPLKKHERLAGEQLTDGAFARTITDHVDTDPELIAAIIDENKSHNYGSEIDFYRRILSGTLDPDKLDYLNRDAYFCGVPYGIQDVDFVISHILPTSDYRLALDSEGVSAVENILFSKYLMYRAIYWHRTVRVATAMIKKAIYSGMNERVISAEELYGLDDQSFFARFNASRCAAFRLIEDVADRRLYKTVWDIPFHNEETNWRRTLSDLSVRDEAETMIAGELADRTGDNIQPLHVILDIPEAVSFELSMPIRDGAGIRDYQDAGTVFTQQVVSDFTTTLRRLRLMVPRGIAERVRQEELGSIVESIL